MSSGRSSAADEKAKKRGSALSAPKGRRSARIAGDGGRGSGEDRRTHIVNAAAQLFARQGFEATSVRQIATDVSILSGSLYHHFVTKDEILYEVVKDAAAILRKETLRIARADADAETKLVALVLMELGELVQNHRAHAILYNERKLFRRNAEFLDVREAKKSVYEGWRSILEAGMAAGLFDKELDLYQTIRTIMRMLNSAADWYAGGEETTAGIVQQYSFEAVQAFYLRFILGAVRDPRRACEPVPREAAEGLARRGPS